MMCAMLLTYANAIGLAHIAGGRLGAGMGGGVALVQAGAGGRAVSLAVPDGAAEPVIGRPLLGHACQLRIASDDQRIGGEGAFGVAECHGAGQLGIVVQGDVGTLELDVLADAGDIAQALQRRQLVHVLHPKSPRQSATQASEAPQARDMRDGSRYDETLSAVRGLPADRLELACVQRPLRAGGATSLPRRINTTDDHVVD